MLSQMTTTKIILMMKNAKAMAIKLEENKQNSTNLKVDLTVMSGLTTYILLIVYKPYIHYYSCVMFTMKSKDYVI